MNISESKNICFIIENTIEIERTMNEKGRINGSGYVSMHDEDSFAIAEYESDIKFTWTPYGSSETRALTKEENNDIYDYVFDCLSERDLMMMKEGYELDITNFEDESIAQIIAKDGLGLDSNTIELRALQFALDEYLSDSINAEAWSSFNDKEAIEAIDGIVWKPFENYPLESVLTMITNTAAAAELLIKGCK